ncbi:MAG: glycosyltransferase, partial [Rhodothermales bacterium]|nr:glycosyltransferase [Rhodothermales bacterium]
EEPEGELDGPAVHYVRVPDPEGHLQGKALAIHAAAEACDHDLLLVTDADCAPPPGWARGLVAYFDDPDVGVVCGQTYVEAHADALSRLQALDWAFLLASCSALVEVGRPVTAMGNNMAFRRTAYDAVGGYPALPFSVTEDYVLFKTIVEDTPWRARFPATPDVRNYTLPLRSIADVYQQRRRWARGGLRARWWVYVAYAVVHLAHVVPLALLAVQPLLGLAGLVLKSGADFGLLGAALGPSRRRGLLREFPLWSAYSYFYMATLPAVLLLFPRINWKDRKL